MIHTSRQLKDLVRNLAKSTGIEAHVLIRRYMMERLLERVSLSPYKDSFGKGIDCNRRKAWINWSTARCRGYSVRD